VRFDRFELAVRANVFAIGPQHAQAHPRAQRGVAVQREAGRADRGESVRQRADLRAGTPSAETMAQIAQNPNVAQFGGAVIGAREAVRVALDPKDFTLALRLDTRTRRRRGRPAQGPHHHREGPVRALVHEAATSRRRNRAGPPRWRGDPDPESSRQTGLDALNASTVATDGEVTRITVPRTSCR